MLPITVYPKCQSLLEGNDCDVDLTVLVDRTGSGTLFSQGVELSSRLILDAVAEKIRNLQVSVQTHGDEFYGEYPSWIAKACSASEALQEIQRINYCGGGDDEETHLSAVETALQGINRQRAGSRSRRVILMFVNDDTKPARSGRSATEIGQAISEAGILFYLICQPTPTLTDLAESARGSICEISNAPSVELMQEIARQISGSVIHSVAIGSTNPLSAALTEHDHGRTTKRLTLISRLLRNKRLGWKK